MLKAKVNADELKSLSADLQALYQDDGTGVSVLQVQSVDGLELGSIAPLRKALEDERGGHAQTKRTLSTMQTKFRDIDADAARDAIAKVAEMANWDPDKKLAEARAQFEKQIQQKFDGQLAQLSEKHANDLKTVTGKLQSRTEQLSDALLTRDVVSAITEHGGSPELLTPVVRNMLRAVETEDGRFRVEVIGDGGTARLTSKPGSTELMGVSELVGELKKNQKYSRAFDGSGAAGSGAGSSGGRSSNGAEVVISSADAADVGKYRAARAQAEKLHVPLRIGA